MFSMYTDQPPANNVTVAADPPTNNVTVAADPPTNNVTVAAEAPMNHVTVAFIIGYGAGGGVVLLLGVVLAMTWLICAKKKAVKNQAVHPYPKVIFVKESY